MTSTHYVGVCILLPVEVICKKSFVKKKQFLKRKELKAMSQKRKKPIQISSIKELQRIRNDPNYPLDGYYELTQDIDASETINWYNGIGFRPIGTLLYPFEGKFDGKGHKITGLYIKDSFDENRLFVTGLFGLVESVAEIKNVVIENAKIFGWYSTGALVGDNYGTVRNCYSINCSISGYYNTGGLIGENDGTISCCYSTSSVFGYDWKFCIGGLVGDNYGTIVNCYNTGSVNGYNSVGGLTGRNSGPIINSYNTGSVSGEWNVGGLVGENFAMINNCYNQGFVYGVKNTGGLVGESYCVEITNSYNIGSISGVKYVGGLIGYNKGRDTMITNSYNTGSLSGQLEVRELVGFDEKGGIIINSYNINSITQIC